MKNLLLAAALVTLAHHAFAGPVEAPAADAAVTSIGAAFASPISRTIIAAGAEQVAQLGSPSLAAISDMVADQSLKKNAAALLPLGRSLQGILAERGQSLKEFSALPTGERVQLLKEAAGRAEAEAERQAEQALSQISPDLSPKDAAELAARLGAVGDASVYLKEETAAKIAAAAKTAKDIAERPRREREAFFASLGRKLVDGAFTGETTFEKTAAGWHFADYPSDERVYGTLEQAIVARMELAHQLPAGPWKQDVNGAILEALRRPELVAELKTTLNDAAIDSMRASAAADYETALADTPKLAKAVAGMRSALAEGKAPSYGSLLVLAKHYSKAADNYRGGLIGSWRVAAGMLNGSPEKGYPSIDELERMRVEAYQREHRRGITGLKAMIAGGVAIIAAAVAKAPLEWIGDPALMVIGAAFMSTVVALLVFIWRRDTLSMYDVEMDVAKMSVDMFEEHAFPLEEGEYRRKRSRF